MSLPLDFEKPIFELENQLANLKSSALLCGVDVQQEVNHLEKKIHALKENTFLNLTCWQKVQLARHPLRPHASDYIYTLFPNFKPLYGDRCFREDPSILGGVASFPNTDFSVMIIGNEKGRSTKQKMEKKFGMSCPEGYRKALRLMKLANRFQLPLITLIDTPGAYPGIEAEQRGQAQAIAECIEMGFHLTIPVISIIIGEGGSGGALALAVCDKLYMQEHSIYSVISPESCASILWNDARLSQKATEKLKINAHDLQQLGVIDGIIAEPDGGAHQNKVHAAHLIQKTLEICLPILKAQWIQDPKHMLNARYEKFRSIGNQYIQPIL